MKKPLFEIYIPLIAGNVIFRKYIYIEYITVIKL